MFWEDDRVRVLIGSCRSEGGVAIKLGAVAVGEREAFDLECICELPSYIRPDWLRGMYEKNVCEVWSSTLDGR